MNVIRTQDGQWFLSPLLLAPACHWEHRMIRWILLPFRLVGDVIGGLLGPLYYGPALTFLLAGPAVLLMNAVWLVCYAAILGCGSVATRVSLLRVPLFLLVLPALVVGDFMLTISPVADETDLTRKLRYKALVEDFPHSADVLPSRMASIDAQGIHRCLDACGTARAVLVGFLAYHLRPKLALDGRGHLNRALAELCVDWLFGSDLSTATAPANAEELERRNEVLADQTISVPDLAKLIVAKNPLLQLIVLESLKCDLAVGRPTDGERTARLKDLGGDSSDPFDWAIYPYLVRGWCEGTWKAEYGVLRVAGRDYAPRS
jgi:hypothetical protein